MPPGHELTRFYALIPILAALYALNQPAFTAVTAALAAVEALIRLKGSR
jgi:hypothetical protein